MNQMYDVEFILQSLCKTSCQKVKNALAEFTESIEMVALTCAEEDSNFSIKLKTSEPTIIFDICAQFGRIKSAKINELPAQRDQSFDNLSERED